MYCEFIDGEDYEGFLIRFYACDEHERPQDHFALDVETETDIFRRIDSGDLQWFCAKVTASKAGVELAADYLGCCCYESALDFVNERGGYYEDMRAAVVEQAKAKLAELAGETA